MALPYKENTDNKKKQVAQMFNNISARYDFLNHLLSMGIDKLWRKKAISLLKNRPVKDLLDIASGTGDFALAGLKLNPQRIIGSDISEGMLNVGKEKINKKGLQDIITFELGDAEDIKHPDHSFDAITVGFGVRNFENLEKGLSEMHRVLRANGQVAILEFSKPRHFPIKQFYNFYFLNILPLIGKMVSKDASAYTYLPESVQEFPDGTDFINIMKEVGYRNVKQYPVTFGIASIYWGEK